MVIKNIAAPSENLKIIEKEIFFNNGYFNSRLDGDIFFVLQ